MAQANPGEGRKSQFSLVKNTYFYVKCHGFFLKFDEIHHKKTFFNTFLCHLLSKVLFLSFSICRALKCSKNLNFEKKNHIFGQKVFKNQNISHFILYKAYFYCKSTPAIMILLSLLKKIYLGMLLDEFWPKSQIFDKYGFLMGKSFHLNMDKFAKISHDVVFFSPKMIRYVLSEHP